MNKKDFKVLLATIVVILLPFIVVAQPGDPGDGKPVPVSGIELLLIGGGLFGAKKMYDQKRRRK